MATVFPGRRARLSKVDVTPETVRKGDRIAATGTLAHDDRGGTAPSGYAGRGQARLLQGAHDDRGDRHH
ncbi:hypothetical protein [Streptomyces sp. NPDC102462]|uniref:hypothetical protein n=1 Tax=Streptomyces sp. NPDC102462 TaxID=3366178 RepID=UPI00380B83D6